MSNLKLQKSLARKVSKAGVKRVKVDSSAAEILKEAITKQDIRELIEDGTIKITQWKGLSRHRARARHLQRKKGRQRGAAKKAGAKTARTPRKRAWINKIRPLRQTLKEFKETGELATATYRDLYKKAKGNFFRNKRHLLIYMEQHDLRGKK